MCIAEILTRPKRDLEECLKGSRVRPTFTRKQEFTYSLHSSDVEKGHMIMYQIQECLKKLDTEKEWRTKDQRIIQQKILAGLLRLIYGKCLEDHEVEILDHNGFDFRDPLVFVTMPRRGGKTEAIIQLICVLLLCVPGITIRAVAPSFRTAGGESGLVAGVKRVLADKFKWVSYDKVTEEVVRIKVNGTVRSFHSHPGGNPDK